jgi:4'-phosphopantetheinyl transferase
VEPIFVISGFRCHLTSYEALSARVGDPLGLLSVKELERMSFFVQPSRRWEYALSHAFLRLLLSEALFPGESAESMRARACELRFAEGEFGKPFLEGSPSEGFVFSLSRSLRASAVAFGWNGSLGVDVESAERDLHMTPALLNYAFSASERAFLASRSSAKEDALKLWTRKEAILKADGRGLSLSSAKIGTVLASEEPTELPAELGAPRDWSIHTHASGREIVSVAICR